MRLMTAPSASSPVVCLVDAYSASGGALAQAFLDAGCRLCHVHSAAQVPPIYRGTFRPELFALDAVATEPGLPARLAREGVRAVLPGTEPGTAAADALAFALGLPGNPPSTSHLRRDKFRMGEAVRAAGLAAVRQASVRSAAQARAVVREWGAPPTVVKPVTSVGSDGVRFCDNEEGVVAAVEALLGQTNCLGLPNDAVLVQERLFGQQ
jgi:L-amino acid ligase